MGSGLNPRDPTTARQTTKKKGFAGAISTWGQVQIRPLLLDSCLLATEEICYLKFFILCLRRGIRRGVVNMQFHFNCGGYFTSRKAYLFMVFE